MSKGLIYWPQHGGACVDSNSNKHYFLVNQFGDLLFTPLTATLFVHLLHKYRLLKRKSPWNATTSLGVTSWVSASEEANKLVRQSAKMQRDRVAWLQGACTCDCRGPFHETRRLRLNRLASAYRGYIVNRLAVWLRQEEVCAFVAVHMKNKQRGGIMPTHGPHAQCLDRALAVSNAQRIQQTTTLPPHWITAELKSGGSCTETESPQTARKLYDNYACSSGIQRGRQASLKFSCTSDERTSPLLLLHCGENDRFEDVCGRRWPGEGGNEKKERNSRRLCLWNLCLKERCVRFFCFCVLVQPAWETRQGQRMRDWIEWGGKRLDVHGFMEPVEQLEAPPL